MRPLWRNIGWLLASRGVNAALSLVYLALATRSLGLADFGRFTLIVVMAQAIVGVASFQTWQAIVRWGTPQDVRHAAGFAVALDLCSIAIGTLIAAVSCWFAPMVLPLPPDLRGVAFALCVAALTAIRSTPTGLLRLHDRYDRAAIAEAVLPALRAVGGVMAALIHPCIETFIAAWAVAELGCAAAYWHLAQRLQPISVNDISLFRLPRLHHEVWRFVWATNLSRSLSVLSRQVLLLIVGALGGPALAAGYRVASQLGQALVQLAEAVGRAIYPEFVRQGDNAEAIAASMARLALIGGTAATLLALVGGAWAIEIIAGPTFVFAATAMVVLTTAGACELWIASWDALLVAKGWAATAFAIRAVPLALSLAAIPWAIAWSGLQGVAISLLASSLCMAAGFAWVLRYRRSALS